MLEATRLFYCGRCQVMVCICRRCDRGQIYCGPDCAASARREAQRAAGRRYQQSRPGRFAHAARTRRYRERRKIVTHQGSAEPFADAVLAAVPEPPPPDDLAATSTPSRRPALEVCCRCHAPASGVVRLDFLGGRRARRWPPWTTRRQ